jgi:hypothetical protein
LLETCELVHMSVVQALLLMPHRAFPPVRDSLWQHRQAKYSAWRLCCQVSETTASDAVHEAVWCEGSIEPIRYIPRLIAEFDEAEAP